jgi:long-chain fatty acid transport protein
MRQRPRRFDAPPARRTFAVCSAALLLATSAAAQSSLQVPIQFDFLNPSARSLALGSAFVGLADDATAALVNPAGLIALTRKEISAEVRYRRLDQPFLVGGRLSGPITGMGQDTVVGAQFETITDSETSLSFASFVYPRGRFRVAGFWNDLIRVDQNFNSRGPFQNHGFDTRDTAFSAERTLTIGNYGVSAAVDLKHLWAGAGLLVQHFSLGFEFDRFAHVDFYEAPDPQKNFFHFSQDGDDTSVGAVVGALVPISSAKVGVSYKRAPRFEFSSFSGGLLGTQQRTFSEFKVPDTFALGFSDQITPAFLITTEYTRVFHSQLFSDYVRLLASQGESRDRIGRFTIDDANEFHVGAEYLFAVKMRPGIRAGVWFDPDHSVHYAPTPANDLLDERIAANLSSGRDLWHYTLGGMVSLHPRVDVSGALDHSARSLVISTSVIVRF